MKGECIITLNKDGIFTYVVSKLNYRLDWWTLKPNFLENSRDFRFKKFLGNRTEEESNLEDEAEINIPLQNLY